METFKAWAGIVGTFLGLPLLLWFFAVEAPFMAILTWVVFFIGVPMFWKKFSTGDAVEFWKNIVKNGIKIGVSLLLFLLVRAYFTLLIGFAPFESWVSWSTSTGDTTLFGYTPTKILFEAVFLFVVGYLVVIKAVYEKTKNARAVLVSFLIFCFLLQTFSLGAGAKATQAAKAPLKQEALTSAVEKYGVVWGLAVQLKTAAFGKRTPVAPPNEGWMAREIKPTPEKVIRIYNGDKFVYKAPFGFWILEEGGPKHFHNPSMQQGEIRSFNFYDLPPEGREIKIQTEEKKAPFWMDFKIIRGG